MKDILVVGAGFSGAVLANCLSADSNCRITIVDQRNHLAGNCHTKRCEDTNIMQHMYGAHIFHTSDYRVWKFVNRYADFRSFINTPFAQYNNQYYSLPINLDTLERYFKRKFTPESARSFIEQIQCKEYESPKNFKEQGLRYLGEELYYAFFHGYTLKQWGIDPVNLPSSIIKRLPVRFNYNRNYYNSVYQGIPLEGYTKLVERLLCRNNIQIILGQKFTQDFDCQQYAHVFISSPIDQFFNYKFGRLRYRTVFWDKDVYHGDCLGHSSVNFPELTYKFTRKREHKHYAYWEKHDKTIVFTEYSKQTEAGDEPYYPLGLNEDNMVFKKYYDEALKKKCTTFIGRLGTYRYLDMHEVIHESLFFGDLYKKFKGELGALPVFHPNVAMKLQLYAPHLY
jgi:UDP-galactopyranose mutase